MKTSKIDYIVVATSITGRKITESSPFNSPRAAYAYMDNNAVHSENTVWTVQKRVRIEKRWYVDRKGYEYDEVPLL